MIASDKMHHNSHGLMQHCSCVTKFKQPENKRVIS